MQSTLRYRLSNLIFSNTAASFQYQSLSRGHLAVSAPLMMMMMRLLSVSSSMDASQSPMHVQGSADAGAEDGTKYNSMSPQNPPEPIPNRPLRGGGDFSFGRKNDYGGRNTTTHKPNRVGGGNRTNQSSNGSRFTFGDNNMKKIPQASPPPSFADRDQGDDFLERFKLGHDNKGEKPLLPHEANCQPELSGEEKAAKNHQGAPEAPPPEADEIFKKMKETGLIPNAVAMLDGLCKDGLVQEAMKLFGMMREKGTIPEVVIYTAVVEGFFKAQKPDDAVRIFRKMQNNGITPNAFSYTVLIQGLLKGKRFEDAVDCCVEMLEAGHSPNVATFTGLIDGFCREKSVEEAKSMIGTLKHKGFSFDERAVKEYLDKKGPFLPLVWEAIFGKKSPQRFF